MSKCWTLIPCSKITVLTAFLEPAPLRWTDHRVTDRPQRRVNSTPDSRDRRTPRAYLELLDQAVEQVPSGLGLRDHLVRARGILETGER